MDDTRASVMKMNGGQVTIVGRNVNEIWRIAVPTLRHSGVPEPSRAGDVIVMQAPVLSIYIKPCERVLFDSVRNANPYFHFFEALWMLAGRNDAAFLNRFVRDFGERFAEKDMLWGAYGNRWRHSFDSDQLDVVVERLKRNPYDRRIVIAMWDPALDLFDPRETDGAEEPYAEPKDLPCNTHIYLRVRRVVNQGEAHVAMGTRLMDPTVDRALDLTVMCRSNDIVWGAYGANAVHFSFLQEYLAGRLGVGVGRMFQFSNNWHAYENVLNKQRTGGLGDPYGDGGVTARPIGTDWATWDENLYAFLEWCETEEPDDSPQQYSNAWFHEVAEPMFVSHMRWREGNLDDAFEVADMIQAPDWQLACKQWLQQQIDKKAAAGEGTND